MRNKRRTREEILEYHRQYNKTYKGVKHRKGISSLVDLELKGLVLKTPYSEVLPINEDRIEIEEINCSYNGCGKTLTRTEKLFGDYCITHSKGQTQNIYHKEQLYK